MKTLWTFLLVWGVWLIAPLLVDGFEAVARLWLIRRHRAKRWESARFVSDDELPRVTVIVPCHNEAEVIDRCIYSLKAQDIPHDKLEIIIVDDGSVDETAARVESQLGGTPLPGGFLLRGAPIKVGEFHGKIALVRNGHAGKAHALNAGIRLATGDIIVNIDSDVVLDPRAVRAIGRYFVMNPEKGAATGNIEIDWDVIEQRDENGDLVLDENGDLIPANLGPMQRFLAKSQFLEYLSAFSLGRQASASVGSMPTLAGACSAFRRELFDEGLEYLNDTVSEDTLLTFNLHRKGVGIGFIHDAYVHLEPVTGWDALYAQRMRWSRGQLEVVGLNADMLGSRAAGIFGMIGIPKMVLFDHTMAFPRLVWMPLLLCLPLLGYSWRLLAAAVGSIYAFYLLVEITNAATAYSASDRITRRRIEQSEWSLLGMPLYRFVTFFARFAGFLAASTEEQQWTVRGPFQMARDDVNSFMKLRSIQMITSMLTAVMMSMMHVARAVAMTVLPALLAGVLFVSVFLTTRKSG